VRESFDWKIPPYSEPRNLGRFWRDWQALNQYADAKKRTNNATNKCGGLSKHLEAGALQVTRTDPYESIVAWLQRF